MRIGGPSRSSGVGGKGEAKRSGGTSAPFYLPGEQASAKAAPSSGAGPITAIDAILALQGVDDPLSAKRKAVKRGNSLLDILDEMKAELLGGRMQPEKLDRLVKLLQQARTKSDPEVDAVVDEIELRARVELAKYGRFPALM